MPSVIFSIFSAGGARPLSEGGTFVAEYLLDECREGAHACL